MLPGGLKSWSDLLDPKFKGKIGAVDDPQGNLALVCHILGKQPDKLPKDSPDMQQIKDYLTAMWAQTTGVSASYGDMTQKLVSGDIVACWMGWAAMNTFAADKGTKTVEDRSSRRRARTGSPTRGRSRPEPTTSRRSTRG